MEIFATSTITVALVAAALWLSRTWITARLTSDIRLENDSKLEALRSDLKRANETLANITAAGDRAFSQSQVALLSHKIKAIERVWASVIAWNEMYAASTLVSVLPMDWVRKYGSDPSTKENFEVLLKAPNHLEFLKARSDTELTRPFLSERGWALYSAYSGFYISRVTKASILLFPKIDHAEVWARLSERDLVKASAPEKIVTRYDLNVIDGTNAFLKYLKDEMVTEFRAELSGSRETAQAPFLMQGRSFRPQKALFRTLLSDRIRPATVL
jgi:hypothetical protein